MSVSTVIVIALCLGLVIGYGFYASRPQQVEVEDDKRFGTDEV
jgi:phosphatidylglycerophosphatase A